MATVNRSTATRPSVFIDLRSSAVWMLVAVVGLSASGCNRALYRKKADREAYELIDQKVCHSGEDPGQALRIEVSQQSRMFDPFDIDRPPMPQDDPKSHQYMHCVDGKRGYPMWHAAGNTNTAENPDWWRFLPLDERGVLVLDSDTAFQLARMHSPGYQQELETLYLSALDVSSERFRFDTQFFGGFQSFYTADGRLRSGAGGESSSNLAIGPYSTGSRPWSVQRSFTTGADLVVGMANSIVWEFSGPNTQSASTVLDFTLVQPLLRGAGRDRVMERLTLSERRLLANVRAFERYRRSFYLSITTGRSVDAGPSRSGGVFGVGLEGFSGLGGGFAGLSGGGNSGLGGGASVAQAGGFLGLLQDQLQIQNQEENVARLRENLLLLNDTLIEMLTTIPTDQEAIPRQRLQVAQAQQALLSAQSQLVSQQSAFNSSVDSFLGDLGLPPYLCVEIRDPVLNQFQLISPALKNRRNEIADIRTEVGNINTRLLQSGREVINPITNLPELKILWSDDVAESLLQLQQQLEPIAKLQQTFIEVDLPSIKHDIEALAQAVPDRQRSSAQLSEIYLREKDQICTLLPLTMVDSSLFDPDDFDRIGSGLRDDYAKLEKRMTAYAIEIESIGQGLHELLQLRATASDPAAGEASLSEQIRDKGILAAQDLIAAIAEDVLVMQLIQARARIESVSLPEVDISAPQALEIARNQRRDWANARASLVDSWRLIEFNADDLESSLDVTFSGDIQNTDSNPFKLRSDAGRLRAGLQWDAPLTRLQERNTYRQSLIEFQQARRSYYQFEDGVWQLLRGQIRQLRANQVNFELQRSAVRMAAEQISLNEDLRLLREARGLSSGPTAARDIIFALSDLLNAQNGFLNIWVNYEVVRRNLDLDMGTMELTPDGYWIDPVVIRGDTVGASSVVQGDDQGMIVEASEINFP